MSTHHSMNTHRSIEEAPAQEFGVVARNEMNPRETCRELPRVRGSSRNGRTHMGHTRPAPRRCEEAWITLEQGRMGITGSRRRVSLGASKALHSVRTDSKLFGDLLQARAPRRWLDYLPGAGVR
jgi:hypothetical protein